MSQEAKKPSNSASGPAASTATPTPAAAPDAADESDSDPEDAPAASGSSANSSVSSEAKKKKKKKKKKANPNSESAAFAEAASDPRLSAYDRLNIHGVPKQLPQHYQLATDRLAQKVNFSSAPTAPASSSAAASPVASSSVPSSSSSFPFRIYISPQDALGRRAIATRDLGPGVLMLREHAIPSVIHQDHRYRVCHSCMKTIYPPINPVQFKRNPAAGIAFGCAQCERAFYCSPACKAAHQETHSVECSILQQIERISDEALVNVDLCRAALAYIVKRRGKQFDLKLESKTKEDNHSQASIAEIEAKMRDVMINPEEFRPDWEDGELMISHEELMGDTDRQHCFRASTMLLAMLPQSFAVPPEDIVRFMARVNSNSHALAMEEHANSSVHFGFGLYPLCAIFNHSCYPNCVFINEGDRLLIRTIRPVARNDELTVNYIGLYASCPARRFELWTSKRFHCNCRRCILQPANEEEKEKFLHDQYLGGVLCTRRNGATRCPGLYRMIKPIVISIKENPGPATGVAGPIEIPKPILRCSECGSTADLPALSKLEQEAKQKSEAILELYATGSVQPAAMKAQLEAFKAEFQNHLHPSHEVFFNVSLPLINCYSALKDLKSKLEYVKSAIAMSERVFPANFVPLINYYDCLSDTLGNLMNSVGGGGNSGGSVGKSLPKKMWQKYKDERVAALERMVAIHRVCHGEENAQTKAAVKMLADVKASKPPEK